MRKVPAAEPPVSVLVALVVQAREH